LFETKEYRINPSFRRSRKAQDSAAALAYFLRKFASRSSKKQKGGREISSRRPDLRQKCVVKMQYSKSMDAHRYQFEEYLIREGAGVDGGRAELYGTDTDEYKADMADKNFRIFLSPKTNNYDLKNLAKEFIKKLEQQTGYSFYWQAANHYNTAHHHAHLLINGKDKSGREIDIPRDVVKTFMREYARDICTMQAGYRTKQDLALEKEQELEAPRFTKLDEHINELCGSALSVNTKHIYTDKDRVLTRLECLRKMGMCNYAESSYKFIPEWEGNLRANGRYNTFLKARQELKYTDQAKLKVYTGETGAVTGRVAKVFKTEEDASDSHAVILETYDGRAFFIPLFKEPVIYDVKGKAKLKENDVVSIETYSSQKGRLTPLIFNSAVSNEYRERIKGFYSGRITVEELRSKPAFNYGRQS
jgi:hypothetical protein